jgi:predicted nucleotidyltransferase
LKSIALAPHQVRALDSLGVLFASHRSVLIGALAIQCQVPMPRLTADVDVIMLASDASIAGSLGAAGWAPDRSMVHRWRLQGAVVDIIQVTDDDLLAGVVNLNGAELSVVGFDLAFSEGNAIRVTPATEVLVPPLPVLVLLKMIAWMDRPFDRAKDLGDIAHIWDHALSDDERWAEPNPWLDGSNLEYDDQGAFFVGLKLGQVAGPGHIHWAKRFLDQVRNEDSLAFAQFVRASHYAGDKCRSQAPRPAVGLRARTPTRRVRTRNHPRDRSQARAARGFDRAGLGPVRFARAAHSRRHRQSARRGVLLQRTSPRSRTARAWGEEWALAGVDVSDRRQLFFRPPPRLAPLFRG